MNSQHGMCAYYYAMWYVWFMTKDKLRTHIWLVFLLEYNCTKNGAIIYWWSGLLLVLADQIDIYLKFFWPYVSSEVTIICLHEYKNK